MNVCCENWDFPSHMRHITKQVSVIILSRGEDEVMCLDVSSKSWQEFLSVLSLNCFWFFIFQMICSTVQKASPQRFSASTSPPWRGTRPIFSEQSFELCGSQTPAPRGTNSGLSSTRCVKVPFPCPTESRGKGNKGLLKTSLDSFHLSHQILQELVHCSSSSTWHWKLEDQIAVAGNRGTRSQKASKALRVLAEPGPASC